MLIFLTSLIGFLPDAQENIFRALASVMPGEAMKLVHETIHDVVRNRGGGLISIRQAADKAIDQNRSLTG